MAMTRTTEAGMGRTGLEDWSTVDVLQAINAEDKTVAQAVERAIPAMIPLADVFADCLRTQHRVFYIGAGTSGRLGVVDASELPPTYGLEFDRVVGIMAGGDSAIRKAVEFAEDDTEQAWLDLLGQGAKAGDLVIGIAASGSTPYVVSGIKRARQEGLRTGGITMNEGSALALAAEFPVEIVVGPEFVRGSTRMKSGTAQKMALNMLSTTAMIRLGRVKGEKMVDMQLTNHKLWQRAEDMVVEETGVSAEVARQALEKWGSVRRAVEGLQAGKAKS